VSRTARLEVEGVGQGSVAMVIMLFMKLVSGALLLEAKSYIVILAHSFNIENRARWQLY